MATQRTLLRLFELANKIYARAQVHAFVADALGNRTSQRATLYSGLVGAETITNPQTLDVEGKLHQAVYFDQPIVVVVDGISVGTHETGVFQPAVTPADLAAAQASVGTVLALSARIRTTEQRARSAAVDAKAAAAASGSARDQLLALMAKFRRSTSGFFLRRAANLSDVGDAATARTNLGIPVLATQAEMEAAASGGVFAAPSNLKHHPGVAKAWGQFVLVAGVLTTRATYNCSITRTSAGLMAIAFTTPLAAATYAVIAGWSGGYPDNGTQTGYGYTPNPRDRTVNGFNLRLGSPSSGANTNPAAIDDGEIHFAVFGDF